jgi:pyruvate/2-oxoglutarate dehydrogenase complex dihydrolipoamide acyltransferase (E2) component
MALVVEMPRLSDTMREGTIVSWLKKEGDTVQNGDLLAEVETDKAVMDFEAEEDGVIRKVLIDEKDPAPIGTPICIIGEADEDLAEASLKLRPCWRNWRKERRPKRLRQRRQRPQLRLQSLRLQSLRLQSPPLLLWLKRQSQCHNLSLYRQMADGS